MSPRKPFIAWIPFLLAVAACAGPVASEEAAEMAVRGLEEATQRTLLLGFLGFNAANSANIPSQTDEGDESGTIVVTGQVDQGASANKGMRLAVALADYSDGDVDDATFTYSTGEEEPVSVDLSLRDIPTGTATGTIIGQVLLEGDLSGPLSLDYDVAGVMEDVAGDVRLVQGQTEVVGTATSDYGTYEVDLQF